MVDSTRFEFTNKELLVFLLEKQGIHEGNWALQAKFTFAAMNISGEPNGSDALPAGVVALAGVGMELVAEPLPFSVNAAEVNPKK